MKLRNKKTGEITEDIWYEYTEENIHIKGETKVYEYNSLAGLNEEWEDYEEPKTFWAISWAGEPEEYDGKNTPKELKDMARQIGNYFETKEEAEKAVEKLKAWKRLKEDKEVKFEGWKRDERYCGDYTIKMTDQSTCDDKDLDLLFGGEDE